MSNKGGRQRQEAALVRRTGKPSWFIRFYDERTKQTRHVSAGTADRQFAEVVLKDWIKKHPAAAETPQPKVLPAQLPPGVSKVRKNQNLGRDAKGHRIEPEPQARLVIPDLEDAKKAFSTRMKEARIAAGLSQAQVVEALYGLDTPEKMYWKRYQNWEVGRSFMTQNVIPVFASLVGTDCNFLFSGVKARG
jgi:hypothetical protein